jgi:thiamine pyrophosphate-dependent acetolactate synthase large subunit-like protein
MKPQQVVEALDKVTNGEAIITSDVGQHQMFGAFIISTNVHVNGLTQVV